MEKHSEIILDTLRLYNEARESNPYLYFELGCDKTTGWCAWLIDRQGGVRN